MERIISATVVAQFTCYAPINVMPAGGGGGGGKAGHRVGI